MGRTLLPPLAAFLFLAALCLAGLAPAARAAQSPAYLALGDSLAFGVGAADPSSGGYVALTYQALRQSDRYGERGLELVNLAVPGATSGDLLLAGGQLELGLKEIGGRQQDTRTEDEVEIISIDIGGNDLLALAAPDSPCLSDPSGELCRRRFADVLTQLRQNLAEVLARLRAAAPEADIFVIDLYNPYSGTSHPLETLADLGVQQVNGVIGAVGAKADLGVKVADIFQLFRGRGRQWIAADGLHPNDQGHAVIAEALLAAIEGRQPMVSDELLGGSPAPAADPPGFQASGPNSGDGGDALLLLAIAVPAAFAAGALISAAYFLARGRW